MVNLIGLRYSGLVLIFTEYFMSFPCEKKAKKLKSRKIVFGVKNEKSKSPTYARLFGEKCLNFIALFEKKARLSPDPRNLAKI